jgi:chemotaxis methyl-accepting protein methylase
VTDRGDDSALEALLEQVHEARGFRCDAYKDSCLRRRIAVRMRACGVDTFAQYADRLREDATEYDRLLETLTINVTKFYRNRETWDVLAGRVIPDLVARRDGAVKCWSAGCASGEEPYTLGALLLEQAGKTGSAPPAPGCIDATDFDLGSLEKAHLGRYGPEAFGEMPNGLAAKYFQRDRHDREMLLVADEVRRLVRFSRHNVTKDAPPHPPYDLILFRNVVIYFDRPTQERIFTRMAEALAPGGVFILGKVETLFGPAREMLQLEDVRERVYRRP